jgi:hypothetical protein
MGCKWIETSKLPAGMKDATELPWGPNVAPKTGIADDRALTLAEFVTKQIILAGEEAADAVAIVLDVTTIQFAEFDGVTYGLFLSPEYEGLYTEVCGVRAELPWMIGLGLLGGLGGFVASRKLTDGGLMGSTVGILAGVGLGAGIGYGVRQLSPLK